ncbi:MAG: hypothetical protein ACRDPE_01595 [Solirubrobacterales bacterium]
MNQIADKPAPRRPRAPSPLGVITTALGLFFVVLTLLAIQVRSGRDPALGPGLVSPAPITQPAAGKGTAATPATEAAAIVTKTSPLPPP